MLTITKIDNSNGFHAHGPLLQGQESKLGCMACTGQEGPDPNIRAQAHKFSVIDNAASLHGMNYIIVQYSICHVSIPVYDF
jgi:hypothetical protein